MSELKSKPKCPKCGSENIATERRPDGKSLCLNQECKHEASTVNFYKPLFDEAEQKEKEWFYKRGYIEADLMYADAAHKRYMNVEQRFDDLKPFDKAPGFRRIFMMGYFYGRNS